MESPVAMWAKDINYLKAHIPAQIIDEMINDRKIVVISTLGEKVFYQSDYCIFIRNGNKRDKSHGHHNEPHFLSPEAKNLLDAIFSYFRYLREVMIDGNRIIVVEDSRETDMVYPLPVTCTFARHIEEKGEFPGITNQMVMAGKWKLTE
jgi:hypothetical protein